MADTSPTPSKLRHGDEEICPLCEFKLKEAHPELRRFFRLLKKTRQATHIAWAWRNQSMQNLFFTEKKSNAMWPHSPHNAIGGNGKPCSRALDLFTIDMDGLARFEQSFYESVSQWAKEQKFPILWGGNFKKPDGPHFELLKSVPQPKIV